MPNTLETMGLKDTKQPRLVGYGQSHRQPAYQIQLHSSVCRGPGAGILRPRGLLHGSDLGSPAVPSRDKLNQCCLSSCRSVLGGYLRHRHLGDLPAVEGGDHQK